MSPLTQLFNFCENTCNTGLIGLDQVVSKENHLPMGLCMQMLHLSSQLVKAFQQNPLLLELNNRLHADLMIFECFLFTHACCLSYFTQSDIWTEDAPSNESLLDDILGARVLALQCIDKLSQVPGLTSKASSRNYGSDFNLNVMALTEVLQTADETDSQSDHNETQALLGSIQVYFNRFVPAFFTQMNHYIRVVQA